MRNFEPLPKFLFSTSLSLIGCLAFISSNPMTVSAEEKSMSKRDVAGVVVDRSLLNIDGDIYTLRDFYKFSAIAPLSSPQSLRTDKKVATLYQIFVTSKILHKEAARLGVGLREQDYTRYLEQVARQNNLSVDDFLEQLEQGGQDLDAYRAQVEVDILRAKIFGNLLNSSIPISDNDVSNFLTTRPELIAENSELLLLRQIFLRKPNDIESRKSEIDDLIAKGGVTFSEIARSFSDAPNAESGGLMGLVLRTDLAADFSRVTSEITAPATSAWLEREDGWYLLYVEKRFVPSDSSDPQLREAVQAVLNEEARVRRAQEFFGPELLAKYSVVELF
jgi:peptidyl-prolyl cis-trans isomerase SurA